MRRLLRFLLCMGLLALLPWTSVSAQINTERVLMMGRNALYYEDYVLSIQRFNQVISSKPHLAEPYYFRGLAKFYLEDYAGATLDVTQALQRNPYAENYYVLRGLCLIHQKDYAAAEADYSRVIELNPLDEGYWHNRVLCQIQQKAYARADSCLDLMIARWPKSTSHYGIKAQVKLAQKDTLQAERLLDKVLEMDAYDGSALSAKAMLLLQRRELKEGEAMLDRAIVQLPRNADLYLNRALCRYNRENLRGAMADYDVALELNPNSMVGHYNRGLLRAQVGDDNRAIEDFNYVIAKEPTNHLAIYNRSLLSFNTGDYKGALRDLSLLIDEYPQFWDGYLMRAKIRRKLGDVYGAERDEFKVMKVRIEGVPKRKPVKRTRRPEEKNLEDYQMLVENETNDSVPEYASALRGRIQNRQTSMQLRPSILISYYPNTGTQGLRYEPYIPQVEQMNASKVLGIRLYVSNMETTGTDESVRTLFDDISYLTQRIASGAKGWNIRLRRAMDYYHSRDFESGIADIDSLLSMDKKQVLAYYVRAQLRQAWVLASHPELLELKAQTSIEPEARLALRGALDDWADLLQLDAKATYAYYNKGNVHVLLHDYDLAVSAYTKVLALDNGFADAYYNRGIAYLLMGERAKGLADLSQAGELGLYSAYSLIKQYAK